MAGDNNNGNGTESREALEQRLILALEARRRDSTYKFIGLLLGIVGALAAIGASWASHEAGVTARESAIEANARAIEDMKAQRRDVKSELQKLRASLEGESRAMIKVNTELEFIKLQLAGISSKLDKDTNRQERRERRERNP